MAHNSITWDIMFQLGQFLGSCSLALFQGQRITCIFEKFSMLSYSLRGMLIKAGRVVLTSKHDILLLATLAQLLGLTVQDTQV